MPELEVPHQVFYGTVEFVGVLGGKIHKRYLIQGRHVDDPRCNLDDATRRSSIDRDEVATARAGRLCSYCFPTGEDSDA